MHHITSAAIEAGVPVYVPALPLLFVEAAFTAGYLDDYEEAHSIARLLASYLAGELDPAATGILELRGPGTGVNIDVLEKLSMTAAPEVLEAADFVLGGGSIQLSERYEQSLALGDTQVEVVQDSETDALVVANLHCTPEMIAEQRAALDAASG